MQRNNLPNELTHLIQRTQAALRPLEELFPYDAKDSKLTPIEKASHQIDLCLFSLFKIIEDPTKNDSLQFHVPDISGLDYDTHLYQKMFLLGWFFKETNKLIICEDENNIKKYLPLLTQAVLCYILQGTLPSEVKSSFNFSIREDFDLISTRIPCSNRLELIHQYIQAYEKNHTFEKKIKRAKLKITQNINKPLAPPLSPLNRLALSKQLNKSIQDDVKKTTDALLKIEGDLSTQLVDKITERYLLQSKIRSIQSEYTLIDLPFPNKANTPRPDLLMWCKKPNQNKMASDVKKQKPIVRGDLVVIDERKLAESRHKQLTSEIESTQKKYSAEIKQLDNKILSLRQEAQHLEKNQPKQSIQEEETIQSLAQIFQLPTQEEPPILILPQPNQEEQKLQSNTQIHLIHEKLDVPRPAKSPSVAWKYGLIALGIAIALLAIATAVGGIVGVPLLALMISAITLGSMIAIEATAAYFYHRATKAGSETIQSTFTPLTPPSPSSTASLISNGVALRKENAYGSEMTASKSQESNPSVTPTNTNQSEEIIANSPDEKDSHSHMTILNPNSG